VLGLRRSDEGTKMKPKSSNAKSPTKAPAERVVKDIRRQPRCLDQAVLIEQSKTNSHFVSLLAREQPRITDRLISVLIKAQSKGVISTSNDPITIAVLIQACSFSRIMDDIAGMRMNLMDYGNLINSTINTSLSFK
jgi:hypothetical protein